MSKILVLGVMGMAGHVIYNVLKNFTDHIVIGSARSDSSDNNVYCIDIQNLNLLEEIIRNEKPDYIINCIGLLVDESEKFPENAIYVNALFPHLLKRLCDKYLARMIHISTDCVFSGFDGGGYKENSPKNAIDVYGKTKGLGEILSPTHTTIRTSIIGPELYMAGNGLFNWFFRQRDFVSGYNKAFWSGVTTLELARFISFLIDEQIDLPLVHLTNNTRISKNELLILISETFDLEIVVKTVSHPEIDKSFLTTNAKLAYKAPSYSEMIISLKKYMLENMDLYRRYFHRTEK